MALSALSGHFGETATMRNVDEYRQYAQECIRWASEAQDDQERRTFIEMAKAWTRVALVEHDVARQSQLDGSQQIRPQLNS
jgi:hypothetical protein